MIAERQKLYVLQMVWSWGGAWWLNTTLRNWQLEQSAERKAAKWKKMHVEPAAVHRGTHFVSNPATGSSAFLGVQAGYQVLRRFVVVLII